MTSKKRRRIVEDDDDVDAANTEEEEEEVKMDVQQQEKQKYDTKTLSFPLGDPVYKTDSEESNDDEDNGVEPTGYDKEYFKHMVLRGRLLQVGDFVHLDIEDDDEGNQPEEEGDSKRESKSDKKKKDKDNKVKALARVDELFRRIDHPQKQMQMTIAWCMHYQDLPEEQQTYAEEHLGMQENDYCMSNAYQVYDAEHAVQIIEPSKAAFLNGGVLHDNFYYDADKKEIIVETPLVDSSKMFHTERKERGPSQDMSAFVDCILAAKNLRVWTSFWNYATDVLLHPNKELGRITNPRRQEFEALGYRLLFRPLEEGESGTLATCYCCGFVRRLSWEVDLENPIKDKWPETKSESKSPPKRWIGVDCYTRLQRLVHFQRIIQDAVNVVDSHTVKSLDHRAISDKLVPCYQRITKLLDSSF